MNAGVVLVVIGEIVCLMILQNYRSPVFYISFINFQVMSIFQVKSMSSYFD